MIFLLFYHYLREAVVLLYVKASKGLQSLCVVCWRELEIPRLLSLWLFR
jgi:hypothetical protein